MANDLHLRLSQQIIDLCRKEDYSTGHRLTERELATRLRVSRSPIRAALKYLASKKVIVAKPGSGYFLRRSGRQLERQIVEVPKATAETLYLRILRDRFAERLPDQVSEADLMRRYDVSRGTLHKVLIRLSQEGFAHRGEGHGWVFHEVLNNVENYKASYEVRLAIEPAAIRSPNFEIDRQRIERLYSLHNDVLEGNAKGMTSIELFELDAELHETVASFSHNKFFLEVVRYHNQLRRIVEYESFEANERTEESCVEHVQLLEALRKGDAEWAATLMTRHLKLAQSAVAVFPTAS